MKKRLIPRNLKLLIPGCGLLGLLLRLGIKLLFELFRLRLVAEGKHGGYGDKDDDQQQDQVFEKSDASDISFHGRSPLSTVADSIHGAKCPV